MQNETRGRPYSELGIRFLILVLASILVLAMHQSGQLHSLRQVLTQVVSPVQWRLFRETNRLSRSFAQIAQNQVTRAELQNLQVRNQQLVAENTLLAETRAENERLRTQLAYATANPRFTFQGAHVIGQVLGHDPHSFLDYLVIDLGSAQGVAAGMPVITPGGLVGRVSETALATARVLLITDVASSVSGLLQSSRVNGQVVGIQGGKLEMRFITSDDPVAVGETVVTSRLGGTMPQGIVIGTVIDIEEQTGSSAIHALIAPAVDLLRLESVMVIQDFVEVVDVPALLVNPDTTN